MFICFVILMAIRKAVFGFKYYIEIYFLTLYRFTADVSTMSKYKQTVQPAKAE